MNILHKKLNKVGIIFLIIILILFIAGLTWYYSNIFLSGQTQTVTTNGTGRVQNVENQSISSDAAVGGNASFEERYTFDDSALLGIASTSPSVGFPTGLTQYPNLTWKNQSIEENSVHSYIDIQYPQFVGGSTVTKLNDYIYSLLESIINDDQQQLAQIAKDDPADYSTSSYGYMIDLHANYRVVGVNDGIVSLEIVTSDFTGGGNGNHDKSYTINWDLKSDQLLTPSDIFCSKDYISTVMPLAQKQMNADGDYYIDLNISDSSDWQDLLLSKGGVIFVFQPYTVTSGAMGIIRVFVPDSVSPHFLCLP